MSNATSTDATQYTISDGELVLTLQPAEEGGYIVTSPFDPELITEAESVEEAFANARDAAAALQESRTKLSKQLSSGAMADEIQP